MTVARPPADESAQLLLELSAAVRDEGAIPPELWRRMRELWPAERLARLLDAGGIDRALWPERLVAGPPGAAAVRRRVPRPGVVLLVASIGMFMAFLDDTVVSIAFPNLVASFPQTSLGELSWTLNAYNIAFAALLVPAGRLADLLGRRRIFTIGLGVFTLASALCAIAPSVGALIAARAVQGVGAALLVPSSLGLIIEAYPSARRAAAVGIWAAMGGAAAGLGPSVGGLLVELSDWRLVFLINLPIGLLALRLAGRQLVESRAPGRRLSPDLAGALVLAVAVALLTIGIVEGPSWGWLSAGSLATALAAAGALAAFVARSRRHASPVVEPDLVRAPGFAVAGALSFVGSAGFFALGIANVLFLIQIWGYTPLQAGLAITPAPFAGGLAAIASGGLARRLPVRWLVCAGGLLWACGPLLLLALMETTPNYLGAYLPAALVMAAGVGIAFPLVSDVAVSGAPGGRFAAATALNTAVRQLGAAVGIAILAAFLGAGAESAGAASEEAYRHSWIFAAACFGAVALGALWLPRATASAVAGPELPELGASLRRGAAAVPVAPATPAPPGAENRSPSGGSPEELLDTIALFAGIEPAARAELARRSRRVHLAAGQWLFRQGDEADALYVVRSGRLETLLQLPGGATEVLRMLGPGAVAGELAILSAQPRSASVRCRRDAELLRLARDDVDAVLETHPAAGSAVARVLAGQLQRARIIDDEPRRDATSIAIVALSPAAEAAAIDVAVDAALRRLRRCALVDRAAAGARDDADAGRALARALDRCERDHELVLISTEPSRDRAWTRECLLQCDRVVLVVADAPTALPADDELLAGHDVVLLRPAGTPELQRLLDRLRPRSTQRVSADARAADVARLARRLGSRSVGLVLSGGGARALAHVGVIEELVGAGIAIDRVAGASMGAFVGALLASGMDPGEIDARCYEEWVRRNPLTDYRLPRHSLLRGVKVRAMLGRNLPGLIEDMPLPFWCVSTDIIAAELVVHRRGEIATAVGAGMCVPGIGAPVALGDRLLVDGGVLDNLPISRMAAEGEGPVIACDVTQPEQRSLAPGETLPVPTLMDTIMRVMLLGTTDTEAEARRHADLLVVPDHAGVGRTEFHLLDTMRDSGRRAAAAALERAPPELFG